MIKLDYRYTLVQFVSIVLIILVFFVIFSNINRFQILAAMNNHIDFQSGMGHLLFVLIGMVLFSIAFPASILSAVAYIIFGFFWASLLVICSCILSSMLVFALVRGVFYKKVQKIVIKRPKFHLIQEKLTRKGLPFLCLARYIPIHANFMSAIYAVTSVKFSHFILSCCCLIPQWILFVYFGHVAAYTTQLAEKKSALSIQTGFQLFSFILFIALVIYLTRLSKQIMTETES